MKNKLTLRRRRSIAGLLFVLPFILGLAIIFIPSMIKAGIFSVNKITLTGSGYDLTFVGGSYFSRALTEHPIYRRELLTSVGNMFFNSIFIIVFSFFMAGVLNQKFRGRAVMRAILFLPVIVSAGVIAMIDSQAALDMTQSTTTVSSSLDSSALLISLGLPASMIEFISDVLDRIYQIISDSGVQILIFLAALQTISPSLYDASTMDGATGWENFWKITFPMLSPYILANTVYTVVDSLASYKNPVMQVIMETAQSSGGDLAYSVAMSFIYFAVEAVILAVLVLAVSRIVFYYN